MLKKPTEKYVIFRYLYLCDHQPTMNQMIRFCFYAVVVAIFTSIHVYAECTPPLDEYYAECIVKECFPQCNKPNPVFNYSQNDYDKNPYYILWSVEPVMVAKIAARTAYNLSPHVKTLRDFLLTECMDPFNGQEICKGMWLDPNMDSCSYSLCLNNAYHNGACGDYADQFRVDVTTKEILINMGCPYDGHTKFKNFAWRCWEKQLKTCPATYDEAIAYQRTDEEKMDYWLGVAKPLHTGIYQCKPGYRLLNDTNNVFMSCQSDMQDQCVAPNGGVQQSAQSELCSGNGACNIDWRLTNERRGSINAITESYAKTNDVWMSCTCSNGYTSPAGLPYCSVPPCKDWTGNAQLSCSGHGDSTNNSCREPAGGGAFKCFCAPGWFGEVCQWPKYDVTNIGIASDAARRQQVLFVYHGPTDGSTVHPTHARYSLRFAVTHAQTQVITEPKSGVTTQLRIKNKCFNTPTTPDEMSFLLPLYEGTTSATKLVINAAFQNAWVVDCLASEEIAGSSNELCVLPFQRTGLTGGMQDICEPPADVAVVQFESAVVFCTLVPTGHWAATTIPLPIGNSYFFCWTPSAFVGTTNQPIPAGTMVHPGVGRLVVHCVFSDVPELFKIAKSNLPMAWFHIMNAMRNCH